MLPFLARTFLLLTAAFGLGALGGRANRPKREGGGRSPADAPLPLSSGEASRNRDATGPREGDPASDAGPRSDPAAAAGHDVHATHSADGRGEPSTRETTVVNPAFASYGGSGVVAGVIHEDAAAGAGETVPDAADGDPALLAAPDSHGRTATAEARSVLPGDPLALKHPIDALDFRTVNYGNAKAAERTAAEARFRDDGWTVPQGTSLPGKEIHEDSPAAFKSGGGSGTVHGAPDPMSVQDGEGAAAVPAAEAPVPGIDKEPDTAAQPPRAEGARMAPPDDLTRIDGIGPSIERLLFDHGVFHVEQIARWTPAEAQWADDLTGFPGRVAREKWIDQAKMLLQRSQA